MVLRHSKSPYYTKKEPERREIYATECMKYLTFLDYTTLEARGKSIEANLQEKDIEIAGLKQKSDTDIALLKDHIYVLKMLDNYFAGNSACFISLTNHRRSDTSHTLAYS
jgi:hypothetical protein